MLPTILDVLVPQGIRRRSAGASVPRCGDSARIREVIANTSRYLILRGGYRSVVFVSHRWLW